MRVWDLDEQIQVAEMCGHKYGIVCVVGVYLLSLTVFFSVYLFVHCLLVIWFLLCDATERQLCATTILSVHVSVT